MEYVSTKQKVVDFLFGFFLNVGIGAVFFGIEFLVNALYYPFHPNDAFLPPYFFVADLIVDVVLVVWEFFLIRRYFRSRRYVAIGLLSSLLLPLLLTGFCTVLATPKGFL